MSEDLVDIFCDMVRIDSETGEEKEFISFLERFFTRHFAASSTIDDYGNLIVKLPARDTSRTEPVLFGVHADTVKPGRNIEPVLAEGIIRSKGETILGADDKAGIAELFEAIRTAAKHPPLEIVVSREEEIGSVGAKHIDAALLAAKTGFVIDMDDVRDIVIGGPSRLNIDVTIVGKAAHAGMEPEKGISAIKVAGHAISMLKEGWIDGETTVNVGLIAGGTNRNSVPDKAEVKLECRSQSHDKCLIQGELIKGIFSSAATAFGAQAHVSLDLNKRAYRISEDTKVAAVAAKAIRKAGLIPRFRVICGATDAAAYYEKNIETVAIGMGVKASHTTDEHIAVDDMRKAVEIIRYILAELA